jgi:hypothetical protein
MQSYLSPKNVVGEHYSPCFPHHTGTCTVRPDNLCKHLDFFLQMH